MEFYISNQNLSKRNIYKSRPIYSYIRQMKSEILHSPTLESIIMVEKTIKKYSHEFGKYGLWKKLPKKMMYQTFQVILEYLINSSKIMIDNEGIVIWTYNPKLIKKLSDEKLLV